MGTKGQPKEPGKTSIGNHVAETKERPDLPKTNLCGPGKRAER
jgi:hypothetical protein